VALWKSLFQLVRRPHYWEKTEHGLYRLPEQLEITLGGIRGGTGSYTDRIHPD